MASRKPKVIKNTKLELDMAEHSVRLRSIPAGAKEVLRQALVWVAAGILLIALGWMALGR
jgi:hypothetical protein